MKRANDNTSRGCGRHDAVGNGDSIRLGGGGAACRGSAHTFDVARHDMSGHGSRASHVLHNLFKHQQDLRLTDGQVTKLKVLALDQDRARIRAHADV